ncbi:MAG: hypothetical protein ACRD5B_15630, partial [Nitrososphaeraceae archaeon]
MIFELLFLCVFSIAIFITLYDFNPTYNILVKASLVNNTDIKPNLNKQNWKGEVLNPSLEGLPNSTIEINKTIGVWGP